MTTIRISVIAATGCWVLIPAANLRSVLMVTGPLCPQHAPEFMRDPLLAALHPYLSLTIIYFGDPASGGPRARPGIPGSFSKGVTSV